MLAALFSCSGFVHSDMLKSNLYMFMSDVGLFIFGSISAEQLHSHSAHKRSVLAVKNLPVFTILSGFRKREYTVAVQRTHYKSDQSLGQKFSAILGLSKYQSPMKPYRWMCVLFIIINIYHIHVCAWNQIERRFFFSSLNFCTVCFELNLWFEV